MLDAPIIPPVLCFLFFIFPLDETHLQVMSYVFHTQGLPIPQQTMNALDHVSSRSTEMLHSDATFAATLIHQVKRCNYVMIKILVICKKVKV